MNLHIELATPAAVQAGAPIGEYCTNDLEELASRYAALMDMTAGKNWPDDDMDGLMSARYGLLDAIVAAPLVTESDYRGKLQCLLTYLSDPAPDEISEEVQGMVQQLLGFRKKLAR